MGSIPRQLLLQLILILINAFFAMTEMAVVTLNAGKVRRMAEEGDKAAPRILKMVEEDRYCMDISHQLMATEAILNKANKEILTAHLKSCVTNASTDEEREEKVDELVTMLGKIL